MDDLISRQAAMDALMEAFCDTMIESICKDTIEALPSAHCDNCPYPDDYDGRVQVVRCKDCKHYEEINQPYPQMFCRKLFLDTKEDDFCSYGERRTEE